MIISKFRKLEEDSYEMFNGMHGSGYYDECVKYIIIDDNVSFIIWNKEFANYVLSEMTTLDFFNAMDKIANFKSERYNTWKQRELRDYNIDKILHMIQNG
jgi:hypothetical protein